MSKVSITPEDLSVRILSAVRSHPDCEQVKEIAITPVEITGVGMTWHANIIDIGGADWRLATTVLRQVREDLEPKFELV